ncbi:MAG: 16S rRNA (guanine(966)-N(2))-methyltransferase RsmD [Clostridiales bacterium]|nr:16S rRNA (guanine(966)-N(2))-methyltransferase RsmD [Clostridiales bacterium]
MQIITGKYRARKLIGVDADTTRPTLARVKESIFNLIQFKIADSVVLDLFAGSGAFGAECISRGAEKVYFVDQVQKAIDTIKINTKNMTEDFEIIKSNYLDFLNQARLKGLKFDIVYLDPPYETDFAITAINKLVELSLLNEDSTIIVEHKYPNDLINLPKCCIVEKSKKYGIAYVDVISYKN